MLKSLFWSFYATCYDALNELRPYREMLQRIVALLEIKHGQNTLHILDAGCGTGNLEQLLKETGVRIVALDFSPVMLTRAREKCSGNNLIQFQQADLNQPLPFSDGIFDRIVCVNTLYILNDPNRIMKEFSRVLKIGGMLIVVTPKKGSSAPLILKAHRHSHEADEKWETKSFLGWLWLVFRTFGISHTGFRFIFVTIFNRKLFRIMKVFEKSDLESLVTAAQFKIMNSDLVYGNQCLLIQAKKEATDEKSHL